MIIKPPLWLIPERRMGKRRRKEQREESFFAWWPKRISNNRYVWLQRVERKRRRGPASPY